MNNALINSTINNLGQTESEQQPFQQNFSKAEQRLVSWFFAMIRTAWGAAKFNSQFGGDEDVVFAKRYWGKRICKYDRMQLASIMDAADRQRLNGNDKFNFPDIAQILSLQNDAWERKCHTAFTPERAIENLTRKEHNLVVGNTALLNLKSMFPPGEMK